MQHAMYWLRRNLFSSWLNSALSLLIITSLYYLLPAFFNWMFWDATWSGVERDACAEHSGACWAFVAARWNQFMFGFYPQAEQWRVYGCIALLLAMFGYFKLSKPSAKLKALTVMVFAIAAYILLMGGALSLVKVETHLWGGLFLTLVLAIVGIVVSFPISLLLALGRRSKMMVIKSLCVAFIEIIRGVPLISVLFMASVMIPLFLPVGSHIDKLLRALIGITLFQSAYLAEVIRGGLQAIPSGQYEAAESLGLGYWRMMRLIILPQALRTVIPGIVNTFIGLFKDTTLVLIIGLFDFLGIVQAATNDPEWLDRAIEAYVFCAIIYWIFCAGMSWYSQRLEGQK